MLKDERFVKLKLKNKIENSTGALRYVASLVKQTNVAVHLEETADGQRDVDIKSPHVAVAIT